MTAARNRRSVAVLAALLLAFGCGGGGGGGAESTPTRTPTPGSAPTPTPVATPGAAVQVVFELEARAPLLAASVRIVYAPARAGVAGAGASTACTLASADLFAANDDDGGSLRLGVASATGLALPAVVTCDLDAPAAGITAGDFTVAEPRVAVLDQGTDLAVGGDPDLLTIGVSILAGP